MFCKYNIHKKFKFNIRLIEKPQTEGKKYPKFQQTLKIKIIK